MQAENGRTYSREMIAQWLRSINTSPFTRERMGNKLVANDPVRRTIEELQAEQESQERLRAQQHSSPKARARTVSDGDIGSLHALGEIFAQLDPLRDVLARCLDGSRS